VTAAETMVSAAVTVLERQERIDAALFDSLIHERRRRAEEIRAVARLWEINLPG